MLNDNFCAVELTVSYYRDSRNNELLVYDPRPADLDQGRPEQIYHPVESMSVKHAIEDVRRKIMLLLGLARDRKPRRDIGIEPEAMRLASVVLPKSGFVSIMRQGLDPMIDATNDIASDIPWEVLEEYYGECGTETCEDYGIAERLPAGAADKPRYCTICAQPLRKSGGKLVLDRRISHIVRSNKGCRWEGGRNFLIIADPREDLYLKAGDSKPTEEIQICRKHIDQLRQSLSEKGYRVNLLLGKMATVRSVLQAIREPGLVGIYYFGHGRFPREEDKGFLLLAGGDELSAGMLEDQGTTARFIFLNACEGAGSSSEWGLGRKAKSIGNVFALGDRVVIASQWPLISVQAADAALTFFQAALSKKTLMDATVEMRRVSHERYVDGQADISWLAYRYFGRPDRSLPLPQDIIDTSATGESHCRVFHKEGVLDTEIFDFEVSKVFFRAAKRRVFQARDEIDSNDLWAGLIRCGGLLRYALLRQEVDPDKVYSKILEFRSEAESSDAGSTDRLEAEQRLDKHLKELLQTDGEDEGRDLRRKWKEFFSQFKVSDRKNFDAATSQILIQADRQAATRTGEKSNLITERDLLDKLIHTSVELESTGLIAESVLRQALRQIEDEGIVDFNGHVRLDALLSSARSVVESAHSLAQQRGYQPIPHRLTLAAFLMDAESPVAKLVGEHLRRLTRTSGMKFGSTQLGETLIASAKSKGADTFPLTPETCRNVVLSTIQFARQLAAGRQQVSDMILFAAFTNVARVEFVETLRKIFGIDLRSLGKMALALGGFQLKDVPIQQWHVNRLSVSPNGQNGHSNGNGHGLSGQLSQTSAETGVVGSDWFAPEAWETIVEAGRWAIFERTSQIEMQQLFVALVSERLPSLMEAIRNAGYDPQQYKMHLLKSCAKPRKSGHDVTLAKDVYRVLLQAHESALRDGLQHATCVHLAQSLFAASANTIGVQLLRDGIHLPPDLTT